MPHRRALGLLVLVALLVAAGPAVAAELAGTVTRFTGVAIASQGGDSRPLAVGAPVHVGDKISTAANTRLEMTMTDEATITLGDHSFFVVEEYGPEDGGGAALEMIRGVLVAVSGRIAKARPDNMTVRTPVATIGIRGTTFWGSQAPDQLEVLMIDGVGVSVVSAGGSVVLTEPDTGSMVVGPAAAPTTPAPWGAARIAAARRTVAFE